MNVVRCKALPAAIAGGLLILATGALTSSITGGTIGLKEGNPLPTVAEVQASALDQERGTLARVGHLVGQPRTYGVVARANF